jgi:hypothetical protein
VNPIAEDVVCRGFRVPARSPERHAALPFRFRWDRGHASSFGDAEDPSSDPGIVRYGSPGLVARRTVVGRGEEGEDCGIVFTYRSNPVEDAPEDDDRIIIAIMGYSGCGTLAGTMLACREPEASTLYPQQRALGVLRAFTATYSRPAKDSSAGDSAFDDRVPKSADLVGD